MNLKMVWRVYSKHNEICFLWLVVCAFSGGDQYKCLLFFFYLIPLEEISWQFASPCDFNWSCNRWRLGVSQGKLSCPSFESFFRHFWSLFSIFSVYHTHVHLKCKSAIYTPFWVKQSQGSRKIKRVSSMENCIYGNVYSWCLLSLFRYVFCWSLLA